MAALCSSITSIFISRKRSPPVGTIRQFRILEKEIRLGLTYSATCPRFKKIRRLGALPGLTRPSAYKTPKGLIPENRNWIVRSITEDREAIDVKGNRGIDAVQDEDGEIDRLISRGVNAVIVLGAGTFAVTKLLTVDHDYWHGWTLYEILRYVPEHNWIAYEQALKTNPVLAKMAISGIVYSLGDWVAQCFEGKPLFEFDRSRMFRSGLVGFTLHGSLSHYYYQFCEDVFPFQDWWVVPAKVAFDQTAWAAVWNTIYFVVLGLLRFESPANVFKELKKTFRPMLTAGWKLWPFAHLVTYGLIPIDQRLLWVDCVELIWVTILSTYSNDKSEARGSQGKGRANPSSGQTEDLKKK